jgi:hypothetical protein
MRYHRPWQSYLSGAILIAAAVVFIWGPVVDVVLRALLFFAVLVVAAVLANWGLSETRKRVLAEVARRQSAEEKA